MKEKNCEMAKDNSKNIEVNETPTHVAMWNGDFETIRNLIASGADINAKDAEGKTLLHIVASQCSDQSTLDRVKFLLASGADVDAKDKLDRTPLHMAVYHRRYNDEVVRCLMRKSKAFQSGTNARDSLGQTPLHIAAENGNYTMVRLLTDNGAIINVRDNSGRTPLDLAESSNCFTTTKYLNDLQNKHEFSPLSVMIGLMVAKFSGIAKFFSGVSGVLGFLGAALVTAVTTVLVENFRFERNSFEEKQLAEVKSKNLLQCNHPNEPDKLIDPEKDVYFQQGRAAEKSYIAYLESFFWRKTYAPFSEEKKAFEAGRAFGRQECKGDITDIPTRRTSFYPRRFIVVHRGNMFIL